MDDGVRKGTVRAGQGERRDRGRGGTGRVKTSTLLVPSSLLVNNPLTTHEPTKV